MMRNISICFLLSIVFALSSLLYAQEKEPHIFIVVTWELLSPEGGSNAEFDSLATLWAEKVTKNNEFIISETTMSHMWGSNSSDFVVITEVKTFADVENTQSRNFELVEEAWPDKEERQEYFDAYSKYFGKHSDEIYQEQISVRK
jgi:hypothetical protein